MTEPTESRREQQKRESDEWMREMMRNDDAVEGYLVARARRYGMPARNASAYAGSIRGGLAWEGVQNRIDDAVTIVEARVAAEFAEMRELIAAQQAEIEQLTKQIEGASS